MKLYDVSLFPPALLREINQHYGAPVSLKERLFGPPTGSPGMDWISGPPEISDIITPLGPRIRLNAERRPKGWLLHINGSLRRFYLVGFEPGELQQWTFEPMPGERFMHVSICSSGVDWTFRLRDSSQKNALNRFFQALDSPNHS